jgi:hypothetical protein
VKAGGRERERERERDEDGGAYSNPS